MMVAAIKQRVRVEPGGVIHIRAPELEHATEAEVIVLVERNGAEARPLTSFIGSGKGLFKSVEEVDAYIRELRDEWER